MFAIQLNTTHRKAISAVLGCCGSTAPQRPYFEDGAPLARILSALTAEEIEAAVAAANDLIVEAVPEEGDPHPQRAEVEAQGLALCFTTPGGVWVQLTAAVDPGEWIIRIEFGRDSKSLAADVLMAVIATAGTNHTVGVREVEGDTRLPWDRAGRALARLLLRRDAESDHSEWSGIYGRPVPMTFTIA